MLFYRAALPLSRKTLTLAAGIIPRHRKSIGSRRRKLNPGQQALLVLAYLRKGETSADLTAGFGVGVTTAWRYAEETVELLAARAPKPRKAARDAKKAEWVWGIMAGLEAAGLVTLAATRAPRTRKSRLSQSLNSGVAPVAVGRVGEPWRHLVAVDTSR